MWTDQVSEEPEAVRVGKKGQIIIGEEEILRGLRGGKISIGFWLAGISASLEITRILTRTRTRTSGAKVSIFNPKMFDRSQRVIGSSAFSAFRVAPCVLVLSLGLELREITPSFAIFRSTYRKES